MKNWFWLVRHRWFAARRFLRLGFWRSAKIALFGFPPTRWKNYTSEYKAVTKDELIAAMREATRDCLKHDPTFPLIDLDDYLREPEARP